MANDVPLLFDSINRTEYDIVILDHSCNDSGGPHTAIELLVRSVMRAYGADVPTIIVSEQWMHEPGAKRGWYVPRNRMYTGYTKSYRTISEAYGLLYFSYNEFLWSKSNDLFETLKSYPLHPPWFSHMFIGDIFAGYFRKQIVDHCIKDTSSLSSARNTKFGLGPMKYDLFNKTAVFDGIVEKEKEGCDVERGYMMNTKPKSTFTPADLAAFESKLTGWTEFIDYHEVPGWIINNRVPANISVRTLSLPILGENFKEEDRLILHFEYLKTYTDAGSVMLSVCENLMTNVDGYLLHPVHKVSIPHIAKVHFSGSACTKLPPSERFLKVVYFVHPGMTGLNVLPYKFKMLVYAM